jgi:hypothetical protein
MAAKKIILVLTILMMATPCLAGSTTISGTMSCYMPEHVEIKTAEPAPEPSPVPTPIATGSGNAYEISREERTIKTEDMTTDQSRTTRTNDQGQEQTVTIYTVCAK